MGLDGRAAECTRVARSPSSQPREDVSDDLDNCEVLDLHGCDEAFVALIPMVTHANTNTHTNSLSLDDDVFCLFLQKQKSAQSYIPQGYFPPYEAV